jgi:hypothetical protein
MSNVWFRRIVLDGDIGALDAAVAYYTRELEESKKECKIDGSLEQAASRLPGIFEHRFNQLQEIDGILDYMNTELKRIRSHHFRNYLEKYNRDLAPTTIEKYIDGEDDVHTWKLEISKLALLRNQFTGVTKSLDIKNWQISNVVKLRLAGLEDSDLG